MDPFDLKVRRRFQWSIFDPEVRARIRAQLDDSAAADFRVDLLVRWLYKYLERGRRFVCSLTVEMDRSPWQLVVFGGDCELTPARLVVHETDAGSGLYLHPDAIGTGRPGVDYARLMLEPGDGTVTKASLLARNVLAPSCRVIHGAFSRWTMRCSCALSTARSPATCFSRTTSCTSCCTENDGCE